MPVEPQISAKIVQLGKQVHHYEGPATSTVGEALRAAQVSIDRLRTDIRLNGESVRENTHLRNGDIITVLPSIKGGSTFLLTQKRRIHIFAERIKKFRWGVVGFKNVCAKFLAK